MRTPQHVPLTTDQAHAKVAAQVARMTASAAWYIETYGDSTRAVLEMYGRMRDFDSGTLAAALATELVRRAETERAS